MPKRTKRNPPKGANAQRSKQALIRKIDAFSNRLRRKYGTLPDSTPGIREDREARG
ncbi:MAG: hypothetical protein ABSH05_02155 [Bryobacteraceae bacterium]|jgi:hypothetical protein